VAVANHFTIVHKFIVTTANIVLTNHDLFGERKSFFPCNKLSTGIISRN